MFRKKKPRLSGGSEAEASLYARWIRESIPRAIRRHNAIGSGPFEGLFLWRLNGQEMAAPKVREMQGRIPAYARSSELLQPRVQTPGCIRSGAFSERYPGPKKAAPRSFRKKGP